jgi:iron complex outermembrane receptor protein
MGSMKITAITTATIMMIPVSANAAPALIQSSLTSPSDSAPTPDTRDVADIVVTGSRTAINGNDQPTPVTAVSAAQLAKVTPSSIADGLNKLPVFVGSTSNANTGNATTNASGNFLNLRGLGAIRTLILLDGHRVAATAANGTVDVNTLPELLVRRVDVVTGGASAVYGSDAVTGVVNFVLDDKFNGLKAIGQGGITSRGDNGQYRFGLAAGHSFADGLLHLEGSYEYYNANGIGSRQDRPTTNTQTGVGGAGTAAAPYQVFSNYLNSNQSYGGLIRTGPLAGQQFTASGQLVPFVNGAATGTSGTQNGGDGTWQNSVTLATKLRTQKAFVRADIDPSDAFKAYIQGSYASAYNFTAQQYLSFNPVILAATNAFLTPAQQAAASRTGAPLVGGVPTFSFGKLFTDQPLATIKAYTSNYNITGGLKGTLVGDLHWDLYYSHSKSSQHVIYDGNNNNGREYASLDAVTDPASGNIVCRVTLTNPGLYPGCVPLNPFASVAGNAAAVSWIRGRTEYRLNNYMDDIAGTINGRVFDTWAGPVVAALSGETRKIRLTNTSNAQPTDALSCTGLRFNCTATSVLWGGNVTSNVSASERISEGAFEVTVPLLRDLSFAKSFELNGAVRYAHYSVSGNATTWKIGGTWAVDDQVTFRATRSRDLRAPTLYDLYQPVTQNQSSIADVHTGVNQTVPTRTFGNPDLKPEISYTTTAGVVLRPHFAPGLSLALDYYDISVSNVIALVQGSSQATQAVCEASGGTSPVCALYVRPLPFSNTTAANFPTIVYSQPLNIASTRERGIDVETNYGLRLDKINSKLGGRLDLRLMTTYQPYYKSKLFADRPLVNSAGTASVPPGSTTALSLPKWRVTAAANYTVGPVELGTQVRWRSSLGRNGDPSVYFIGNRIPAYAVVDLNASYNFTVGSAKMEAFITVQNVGDNLARGFGSTAGQGPFVPGDDIFGRTFVGGLRLSL